MKYLLTLSCLILSSLSSFATCIAQNATTYQCSNGDSQNAYLSNSFESSSTGSTLQIKNQHGVTNNYNCGSKNESGEYSPNGIWNKSNAKNVGGLTGNTGFLYTCSSH